VGISLFNVRCLKRKEDIHFRRSGVIDEFFISFFGEERKREEATYTYTLNKEEMRKVFSYKKANKFRSERKEEGIKAYKKLIKPSALTTELGRRKMNLFISLYSINDSSFFSLFSR
jgi:hypothetical protein